LHDPSCNRLPARIDLPLRRSMDSALRDCSARLLRGRTRGTGHRQIDQLLAMAFVRATRPNLRVKTLPRPLLRTLPLPLSLTLPRMRVLNLHAQIPVQMRMLTMRMIILRPRTRYQFVFQPRHHRSLQATAQLNLTNKLLDRSLSQGQARFRPRRAEGLQSK
jgi:hypothetical protein